MYNIMVREVDYLDYWKFKTNRDGTVAQWNDLDSTMSIIDNLLDFYPRNHIKVVKVVDFKAKSEPIRESYL